MKQLRLLGCICLLGSLSACVTGYVDPDLREIRYMEIRQLKKPVSIGVLVEFQRDGEEFPSVNDSARNAVLRVLKKSKLFSAVRRGVATADRSLKIVINNAGGSAKGNAYVTGLTLGAVGVGTIDPYFITATYQERGKPPIVKEYRHAIHGTIGAKSGPKGLEPMSIAAAFDKVVEEVVLLLLYDLQKEDNL